MSSELREWHCASVYVCVVVSYAASWQPGWDSLVNLSSLVLTHRLTFESIRRYLVQHWPRGEKEMDKWMEQQWASFPPNTHTACMHPHLDRSATALKPLTGEVKNIDYLVTVAPIKGWDTLGSKWAVRSWRWGVGSRKNGHCEELNDFTKDGYSISETAGLVGCYQFTVVSMYVKWTKERQQVNQQQCYKHTMLIDVQGKWILACVVWRHKRTVINCQ